MGSGCILSYKGRASTSSSSTGGSLAFKRKKRPTCSGPEGPGESEDSRFLTSSTQVRYPHLKFQASTPTHSRP